MPVHHNRCTVRVLGLLPAPLAHERRAPRATLQLPIALIAHTTAAALLLPRFGSVASALVPILASQLQPRPSTFVRSVAVATSTLTQLHASALRNRERKQRLSLICVLHVLLRARVAEVHTAICV